VVAKASTLDVSVEAEAPQTSIHDFKGRVRVGGAAPGDDPLGPKEFLLRGTVLRNTAFCVGVVVYTGPETRMVMNSRPAPSKQSNLEKITNRIMLLVLVAQAALALLSSLLYFRERHNLKQHWYLLRPDILLPEGVGYWLTFFVLYSNLMPISLYPTMEWCNTFQAYFIKNDLKMFYSELSYPAGVRSSNLCQELGQVSYIFSDKTGTLTQNVMELKRVYIAGNIYGDVTAERGFTGAGQVVAARHDRQIGESIDRFFEVLAVSHTVMVSEAADSTLKYEAESPDESALVEAAAAVGWTFAERVGARSVVEYNPGTTTCTGRNAAARRDYDVHGVNAFDSTRKRMSVVVQYKGEYILLVKGADNVMLERCAKREPGLDRALRLFAEEGLRTLVVGRRTLTAQEFQAWHAAHGAAQRSLGDRDAELAQAAELIEKDLEIVGATAIEDKLQDKVPETIVKIRRAGINLWVLTGDKLETARNIGFSSQVLVQSMTIATIDREAFDPAVSAEKAARQVLRQERQQLEGREAKEDRALMVTGPALQVIFDDDELRATFLEVASDCSIVIACRVSPLQKAQMVRLVREGNGKTPPPVTLSVGDGANDVPMIQEAQVGVGIAGREGRQAVNNSDFSIGQFQYLQRLLLVHGRWNYRRVCKFTLFTFWRNAVQVLLIVYYTFVSGFSGTSLFEDWIRLSFNILCSFPIMATGCFDKDVAAKFSLQNPQLYRFGTQGRDLNVQKMGETLLSALMHSLILLGVSWTMFTVMDLLDKGDYYTFGTTVYTFLLLDMNYRVFFLNRTHNKYTFLSILSSIVGYVMYLVAYPCNKFITDLLAPNMYMVPLRMVSCWPFWICLFAVPCLSMCVDLLALQYYRVTDPFLKELTSIQHASARDYEKHWPSRRSILASELTSEGYTSFFPLLNRVWGKDEDFDDGNPERKPKQELADLAAKVGVDTSDFAQQRLSCVQILPSSKKLGCMALVKGIGLILVGWWLYTHSEAMNQVRVHYTGEGQRVSDSSLGLGQLWVAWFGDVTWNDPLGTREEEVVDARSRCTGQATCQITVNITKNMRAPVLMYYAMGPFYQNYNSYMKSEVPKELMGKPVSAALREKFCAKETRLTEAGEERVPCGMKARSFFNDTFKVDGHLIRQHDSAAWAWYDNPEDYLHRPSTKWLYEEYPNDLIGQQQGVKSEHFIQWMKPGALQRVWNTYGSIDNDLLAGTSLTLTIANNFDVSSFDGWKQIVFTETTSMGARHNGLGYFLMLGGLGCVIIAGCFWFMIPAPGGE